MLIQSHAEMMKIFILPLGAATIVHQYQPESSVGSLPQFVSQARNQSPELPGGHLSWITAPGLRILLTLSFAAMCMPHVFSAVHPVPLDPKTDSAKCIECHDDKTKGKAVHSAIATGCLSCHEIRVNKGTTRVKLITATPYLSLIHI